MTKTFVTTGSSGQQDRVIEFNADEFAERMASAIHESVTKAIQPGLARMAEVEKKQAAASGKRVDNGFKLPKGFDAAEVNAAREIPGFKSSLKLPSGNDEDDKPKTVADQRGYRLPKSED